MPGRAGSCLLSSTTHVSSEATTAPTTLETQRRSTRSHSLTPFNKKFLRAVLGNPLYKTSLPQRPGDPSYVHQQPLQLVLPPSSINLCVYSDMERHLFCRTRLLGHSWRVDRHQRSDRDCPFSDFLSLSRLWYQGCSCYR